MILRNRVGVYEKAVPENVSIPEALCYAQKAGFDFYEINIDRTDFRIGRLYDPDFADAIRTQCGYLHFPIESIGLSALSTYTLGSENPEIVRRAIDIFENTIIFADRIGARIIQIPGCDVVKGGNHTSDTDKRFFDNVMDAARLASSYGILLGVENMEDEYMNSVKKCSRLVEAVNSPYLHCYPDCGNIKRAFVLDEAAQWDDLSVARGKIIGLHLKETRDDKFGGLFYGEGDVNFSVAVKCALSMDVHRYLMEYWYTGNPDWKLDLKKACIMAHNWLGDDCND